MYVYGYVCLYVCMNVRRYICIYMYVCYTVLLVSRDPLRSDITFHLQALRGTPTRHCDRIDLPKVYIRLLYSLIRESISAFVVRC
jgi:hypothetical protein